MRIIGHGIDIVETERIARMLNDHSERFLKRCFTEAEQAYANDKVRQVEHLAGRFAAKEAILKVLGTGWGNGIAWTDAEILRDPSGAPRVELHGECRRIAYKLGIDQWWVSISHISTHAIASAIGVGQEGGYGAEAGKKESEKSLNHQIPQSSIDNRLDYRHGTPSK